MFKTISKTLILTGFLFVSALAFGQSHYECEDDESIRLLRSYTELNSHISFLKSREADLSTQLSILENRNRGLTDPDYPTPPRYVLDESLYLITQNIDVRNKLLPLVAEAKDIQDRLSFCPAFIYDFSPAH